jgi:ureidoglycolate dehydrogenase (NAD+)
MYYLHKAAKAGMIGIGLTHGESLQAPFGGQTPFFGTNPIAFAFPTRVSPPVVVDFATSATTFGKIMQARATGSLLPEGMVLDSQGAPTRDPKIAARILPAAGHKGYGLALAVEILSGILNSCPYGPHLPPVFRDDVDQPGELGHFFMAIDPNCFCGRDSFLDQVEKIIQELHEVPPACGFKDVLVPGEPESRTYAKRIQEGIPLVESLLVRIRALACDRTDSTITER